MPLPKRVGTMLPRQTQNIQHVYHVLPLFDASPLCGVERPDVSTARPLLQYQRHQGTAECVTTQSLDHGIARVAMK